MRKLLSQIHNGLLIVRWMIAQYKKEFDRYSQFLQEGVYLASIGGDGIYEKSHTPVIISRTFSSRYEFWPIIRCLLILVSHCVSLKPLRTEESRFSATECIRCSSGREYKFFDFANRQVLTLYLDKEKLKAVSLNRVFFAQYFCTPKIIECNETLGFIIEELVEQTSFDKEVAFKKILSQYSSYLNQTQQQPCKTFENDSNVSMFQDVFGHSPLFDMKIMLPQICTHGDLWSSNIMYDSKQFYLTDFEAAKERYIYYDFFTYIFSEWLLDNDDSFLNNFFLGLYDAWLTQSAELFNCTFDVHNRDVYFLHFIVELYNERWKQTTSMNQIVFKTIEKFIKRY